MSIKPTRCWFVRATVGLVFSFSINTRGDHPLVRVKGVPLSIHGFQSSLKDSYFVLQPGSEIQVAMVCKQRFQRLAVATNEQRALDRINSVNSATIIPDYFSSGWLNSPSHNITIQFRRN